MKTLFSAYKDSPLFLFGSFLETLNSHQKQNGGLYCATVIARLSPSVDKYHLREKALKTLKRNVHQGADGYWYLGRKNEKIYSIHDQLLVLSSSLYSFALDKSYTSRVLIDLLLPSVSYNLGMLHLDLQKTIGGEVLLTRYVSKLCDMGILKRTEDVEHFLAQYGELLQKKIASHSDAMLYYIEGFEGHDAFVHLLARSPEYLNQLDNIEILAFLSNYRISRAYDALYKSLKSRKSYILEPFSEGEIFNISWQYYILLNSGLFDSSHLTYLAEKSLAHIRNAQFDEKKGIGISKNFAWKDADTTAMVYILLYHLGQKIPLDIFSSYRQSYDGSEFFGSYMKEVRPSMGTMAHILDALAYADIHDPLFLPYLKILHTNLSYVIVNGQKDSDKWHVSRWYFYSNALIAYTHMTNTVDGKIDAKLLSSLIDMKQVIIKKILAVLQSAITLSCEERAWLILGCHVYFSSCTNMSERQEIRQIICEQGSILKHDFYHLYKGKVENLEKMWLVKIAYSPLNIVKILIHSSIMLSESLK